MTTPPTVLRESLPLYQGTMPLRTAEGNLDSQITWAEAIAMAICGDIEAVGSTGGHIRYFRMLRVEERPEAHPAGCDDETDLEGSTAFARTNLGVFREPIRAAVVSESFGHRQAVASGEITGHVWTHCQMRKERQASKV